MFTSCACSPCMSRSTVASSVASPQIRRWAPKCQMSPAWVMAGPSSGSAASALSSSTSSATPPAFSSAAMMSVMSSLEKPVSSMGTSSPISLIRSTRRSLSMVESSARRLSAIRSDHSSASVAYSWKSAGTCFQPLRCAASRRPWPLVMKPLRLLIVMGCRQPVAWMMLPNTSACCSVCWFGFRGFGTASSMAISASWEQNTGMPSAVTARGSAWVL